MTRYSVRKRAGRWELLEQPAGWPEPIVHPFSSWITALYMAVAYADADRFLAAVSLDGRSA